jgi:hypothetical protein
MAEIILITRIKNEIQICFDLARSIDLHKISTAHTNETAIAGCTGGLIGLNEFVTWEAVHFESGKDYLQKLPGSILPLILGMNK